MTDLRDKALDAVEEAAREAQDRVLPKSAQLRFTLAFLGNFAQERWPFDAFWKAVTTPALNPTLAATFGRQQMITNGLNGIKQQLGVYGER
jgi:hypothetical protein